MFKKKVSDSQNISDIIKKGKTQARQFLRTQQYDEAIKTLNQLISIDSSDPENYSLLGSAYKGKRIWDQACLNYRTALEKNPNIPLTCALLGEVYNSMNKHEDSITCFKKAISLNPCHCNNYYNVSRSYIRMGKF